MPKAGEAEDLAAISLSFPGAAHRSHLQWLQVLWFITFYD